MITVESVGKTDVGKKRKGNEDSHFVGDDLKLYIVADGMGGHQAGEVASKLVVETLRDYIKNSQGDDSYRGAISDDTLSKSANRLLAGIFLANRVVNEIANSKESYKGMGSTVSAIYFSNDTLIAGNVGDSPIYLIRDRAIDLLSIPHTVMAEQTAIDPENAKHLGAQFSHMLTRAMGTHETVEPDVCEIQCFKNDKIVISSDGLSDKVTPSEILEIVDRESPEKSVQTLINLANERGGDDNITIIVLQIKTVKRKSLGIIRFISKLFNK